MNKKKWLFIILVLITLILVLSRTKNENIDNAGELAYFDLQEKYAEIAIKEEEDYKKFMNEEDKYISDRPSAAKSSELIEDTVIAPVLETKINMKKNYIYCATAQFAWNSLCNDVFKGTVEIENAPYYVEHLNNHITDFSFLSTSECMALADFIKNKIYERIDKELAEKFNESLKKLGITKLGINPEDIFAFSYLAKSITFKEKFNKIRKALAFKFGDKKVDVKAFGIDNNHTNEQMCEQAVIRYHNTYRPEIPIGLILELKSQKSDEEIIISTCTVENTLLASFVMLDDLINCRGEKYIKMDDKEAKRSMTEYISSIAPTNIDKYENLHIPVINFNVIHKYKDILGKRIKNQNLDKNYIIADAVQWIYFLLNESGAELKSFAAFHILIGPNNPYVIDRPFIIYLKEKKSKYPYFMAYIANDELLVKFEEKNK